MRDGTTLLYWNEKSGTGKTTFACMAAHELSRNVDQYNRAFNQDKGYKCLLLDLDYRHDATGLMEKTYQKDLSHPNKDITQGLKEGDLRDCTVSIDDNLDIIPGDEGLNLSSSIKMTNMQQSDSEFIDKALDSIRGDYDYILIDTGTPCLDEVLHIRDIHVAVDFKTQGFGYFSLLHSISYLQDVSKRDGVSFHFDGIVVHWKHRDKKNYQFLDRVRPDFQDFIFDHTLQEQARVSKFFSRGIDTTVKGTWSQKALDSYRNVIQEWIWKDTTRRNDELDQMGNIAKHILDQHQVESEEGTRNIRIRTNIYRRLKVASAHQDVPIRHLADDILGRALDDENK